MKRFLFGFYLSVVCFALFADPIYKEFNIDGKKINKWVEVYGISEYEYDSKGNMIYEKGSRKDEVWHEYDSNGNEIHFKNSIGEEGWYEYD